MQKIQPHIYKKTLRWFASLLAMAVILNGAHAKDIASLSVPLLLDTKKIVSDEGQHKVAAELHNHVDKQTGKTLKSGDNPQLDSRSLRLLRNNHKKANKAQQSSWWAQLFERYGFLA